MPSLKLADAWKDFTPPSPPEVSGKKEEKKEGGKPVHTDSEMFSVPDTGSKTVFEAALSPAAGSSLSAEGRSSFFLSPDTEGVLEPGNIDLRRRPVVRNRDGSVSMARSFSVAKDGREYLVPTVSDEGRLLSDQEAISQFEKTGRHLGAFRTAQDAAEYADRMDRQQELLYAANPQEFQGVEIQQGSLVAGFPARLPGEAATPLSPVRPRSLFDRPLTSSPLISSSARMETAYRPDPQRIEELNALVLHFKNDPELDALLERNPAYRTQATLDDGSMPARALLGQQILREVAGERYAKEPGFYFLALKEKLPEAATRQEAYAAVYDHYRKAVEKQYEENKARKAAYQKNRAQVDEAVAHVVGGLWSPAELGVRLTPEQTDVYLKEFDTGAVEKAHAAFSLLKDVFSGTPEDGLRRMVSERAAMKITSALSDDDGTGKLTINETAFNLFEGSLRKLMGAVKEQSGDEWKFLHNVKLALFNPVAKRNATLGTLLQIERQQNSLVPFAHEHNDRVLEMMDETIKEYQTYIKNDRENARVLGLLSTGQDLGNQSNERASFAAKTVNCLGSVCGQTAPFFLPYAGWGIALAGAYDDKRNRAYYEGLEPGTAEWSAFVDAAASVAVEKISYGALGRLSGAGWVMGKLPFMGKARKALTDSLWKHVLFEAGAGMVEETFVEPTAEAIIQWAVRSNIAPLAGVDVGGGYDWNNYWNELKGMMEPDQLLATALFVGGLAGGTTGANSLIMQRSLVVNSRSPEMLMSQGIPADEAKRISGITDNGERVAAVREAVSKLRTLPPDVVRKNAGEGVKAFRSLAEVRATVESEAYKFFQKEMRLPLVEEKLDKPGMYNVTVFDVDSGQKKFTQEMAEGQLVSLFGNYFSEDKRAQIAEAHSAFAANAFLRTAEKGNVVQAQDMLQWGKSTGEEKTMGEEKGAGGTETGEESAAGKAESDLSPESDSPGSPVPATPARETREGENSSGSLEDGSSAPKDGSAVAENLSVLGKFIRTVGGLSQTGFSYLTRIALDEWNRRLDSGMSGEQAAAAPFAPLSPYAPLSSFLGLEKAFKERLKIAARTTGEEGAKQTSLFQMGTAPGTSPADILFLVSKGLVGTREMLEDLFEVGIRNLVKGDRARLEAMGGLLRETQAGLQKLGFQGQFISPSGPLDEMKVVEGMSKLALSDTLANAESLPLPQWQKDLLQYHVGYLKDAAYLLNLGRAWNLGREKGTITKSMEDILRDLGHRVHTIYDQARIEQQDIQAVMEARAIVFGNRGGPGGSAGGPTVSQIRERQQRDEEEEKAHVTTGDRSKERAVPKEALQHPETVELPEAPDSMKGVFFNGAAYNPDAGTWLGMVPVDKLHLSPDVPQVKVNSGKKGVVNPLVGDYRADAPPVYVWKRKNGKLEVVSGRHRLDLARRTGTKAIAAYVYEEDADHDARWARLLDYEQNMQDDQADELTAAIYVRETGLTDDELTRRGLTRAGTRSRRGLLIGREAREDLWTRFRSGAIRAQDAEAICLLTRHIQDKGRIDAMQMAAANDLAGGKSLEFVAAKMQLMAHASADGGMVQGLISFGESFEQDMERAAEYVARSIGTINEHINAIKGVRNISKKGNVLATEGITAGLSEDPAERLKELELLKTMYEKIGLYENLRVRALTWDGKTPPDPIGDHRLDMQAERARAEADAAALEDEENRKAAEKLTPEFGFSLTLSRNLETVFPYLWNEAARELNDRGHVSFALNGSRVSIHTLAGKKFREALERGGMIPPVNRVADFSSRVGRAGEIACVLHPESVGADSRSVPLPEGAAGSGRRVPLSDFSGFVIPSSLEESLLPALLGLGVPVRVYHVTGEEAAFLGDPRSMEKNDLRKKKELNQRRNNVIRSFLEETDVSFSLSATERRIFTRARREDIWMKAPDGTPTALTERQWLQVHSEAFREWFGESKIVNEHGEPVVVYHGTARADRVGTVFRGERATSGPMAFFTDNEGIATNYAKDKRDTSIGYEAEDYHDYHQQFRVVLPDGQDIPLERYWNYLSPADQRRVTTLAGQIREDWDGDNSIIVDPSINDANGGVPEHLREARGNAFRALVYHWLESAILFDEEHRFLNVLEKLDLPLSPYYRDPNYQEPKVYACYMRMENPFRTPRITKKIVASLKAASRKAGIARESWRTDLWDKNSVSPEDWIERLEGDYENKTTHAWASIPDWVTVWLRKKGYDGIIDQGGKFHAENHTVCIPFDSVQIKSARDNRGTFDSGNPDITFSIGSEKRLITLRAKKDGTWLKAPNGKRSLLSPRLWSTVRTRAFREWFGDWMNDPANASRVVDENGEPMVVYHGSNYKFTEFDPSFAGSNYDRQELDFGFLFTTTDAYHAGFAAKTAREFENERRFARGERLLTDRSGREYALFANLRNPLIYDLDAHPEELSHGFPETEPDVWDSPRFALQAQKEFYEGDEEGNDYDGILLKGRESSWVLARKSNQLKSATNNRGTYDAADSDITFSLSNLAAVHSLDTEKLAAADKLGGLPLPSLAVTRLDKPYTWGDDDNVYLVGSPALADPARGVEIYDRDMWSGHFPELRWNRREEKEREEFYRKAEQAALRYYGGADISTLRFLKDALDGDHRGALESKLRTNDLSLAVFAGERGYAPRPLMTKIPGRLNTGDRIFYSEIRKMRPDKHANVLAVERQEEFCAAMERAIERYRTQFVRDSQENKLTISQTLVGKINLSEMEKELKEAREDNFDVISHLALIDASQFGKTVPDWEGNFRRFEKYAATHKKAFDAWVKDKMDRWLNPVPRIKENGFPATLENVTRYMLGSKGNGAEYKDSFFPTGLLRAKKSRRFRSLDQIKESRDILVTSNEYDASQEEAQGLIQKFQETLFGIVNDFSAYNKAVEALSLIEGEPTPSKVLSALSRFYRGASYRSRMARNSGNLLGLGAAALHAMKSELRDYYEAVPQRAVQLQEFSHAVMPASLRKNKQIRDILKRHGIRPLYHDGTLEGRTRAMASLMGSAASFSLTSGGDSGGTSEAFSDSSRFRFPASDFMVSLSEEERSLSEKALASGTWLKAPNGEDSRLTPRQWVQVRTAAFRDWFGDWLDDPGHASQVVDENGEPRVVYHGTPVPYDPRYGWVDAVTYRHMPAPFSVFGEGNWHGAKFFFDDYNSARYFASNKALDMEISEEAYTFECFLNARKLFNIRDKEAVIRIIDSFPDSVPVIHPQFGSVEHVSREAASGLVKTFQSWILTETKEFQQKLQELGYDGFVAADHEYYTAVFKSSQIKSATENVGTFDSSSPDITFSVIGLRAETWKQYKEKAFTGRDDGKMRAEIDASRAVLKDRSALFLEPLRREMAALRRAMSGEMKKKIIRFLELHGKFYRNEKDIEAEDYPDLWREYLSLDREREGWSQLLTKALLRTGLYRQQPAGAAVQAQLTSSLEFLLEEDDEQIRALASRGADNTVMTLGEWLDYPELFAAYPKLRSMPVIFRSLEEGVRGQFSPAEWTISLDRNTSDPQNIRSTLLHEIQHAIQQIEGFAKGGSPEAARQFYEFMRREAREAYEQSDRFVSWLNARDGMISMLEYMLSLARNPHRVLRSSYLYSYDNVLRRLEGEERILDMVRYALEDMSGLLEKFYDEDWNHDARFDLPWPGNYHLNTPSGIQECLEAARATPSRRLAYRRTPKPDLGALYRNFLKYEKLSWLSSHELYSRLAGEMEARNVQFRHDWSAEFREDVPFNDSLEFPGEALVSFSMTLTENRPSEDFLSSLSEEERVLAERSWEDGTWLLAPNGEASRLTSRQWLQVRTAAFKRWFGDWEHDPLEASRVVDDNGEPLVVYHGARHAGFTVFDSSEGVSHSEAPPETAFFTNSSSVALSYSGTREEPDLLDPASLEGVYSPPGLYPCFLNIREPWAEEFDGALWDGTGQPLYEFYDNETEDFIFTPNGEEFWKSEAAIREYAEANGYTDYEICNMEGCRTTNTVVQRAMDMCLDGAIIYDVIDMGGHSQEEAASDLYIAFRPEQIKSAKKNRGSFDPRNPDITFSLAGALAVQWATSGQDSEKRKGEESGKRKAGNGDADEPSIRTFRIVQKKFNGWKKDSVNIDLGSGRRGDFTRALEKEGVTCYAYDPFGRHASHEAPVLRELRTGALQGDTVTCNDVLNLIPNRTARFHVIHQAARSLKPDGTAFFSIDEGDGNGQGRIVKTLSGLAACWQENRKAESYLGEVRSFFEDVKLKDGLIVARSPRHTSPPALWRQGREMQVLPQISVAALQKEGYFPQGVLKTANAVLTEPGEDFSPLAAQDTSFSLTAEHASPSSFRKFRDEGKEEEKRVLSYGWGLYFTEDPLKSRAYEKSFRDGEPAHVVIYLIDGERNLSSSIPPDEQEILDEIAVHGWEKINAYVEQNRDVMDLYGVYRTALDKYRGKTVERVWESLPSSTVSSYRVELNVEEAELLTWEDYVPPVLLDTALAFLKEAHPEFHAELMEYQESPIESGRHVPVRLFCPRLQENMGKKEASKWLLSQGIKGLRYYNGERSPGKKYDYVIFDADDIKITGVRDASTNWKNFSPYHDSSASFSVIGPRAETWHNYGDRAFVGRDDGKMRAEIDASQARLDMGSIYERDYSELDDMTGMFTATSDIKPLIGTRAARFYSEAREVSQAYRAGKISDDELNDRYRQLLHKWGFQQEAALVDSDEFHNALQETAAPVIQAVHDVWDFFIKHFLTANAAYVIDWKRESRSAAFNNLVSFMATGDYRFIHAIFPKAGPYKTWMLGEVLDYPELFEAYPVLKGIKVDFREMQIKEVVGELNSFENRLSLSIYALENKSPDEIRSYLLHEVQHAIQDIEGFASGGNFITAPRVFFEEIDRTRSVLNLYLVHLKSGISHLEEAFRIARDPAERAEGTLLYKQYLLEGRTMTDERKRSLAAHFLDKTLSRAREDLNSDVPEGVPLSLRFPAEQITLPTAQEAMKDKGESLQRAIAQAEALLDPLYFAALKAEERYMERMQRFEEIGGNVGAYLRLAGEIESRNVEHRKDWSEVRRAAEPFNDTLEYPGEALVSFSLGDGHSSSHSPENVSQDVSQNSSQDSQNLQNSLQNEYEIEQSIHASSGPASFTERSLLPRSGEGDPGRGHSDESAGSENPGAGEGSPTGNAQAGSALSGQEASGETNAAHSGQFDPAVGVLGIKAYSLSPHLTELAVRNNFYTGDIIEIENSAEGAAHFRRCLEEAKSSQVYGECVYTYDAEEYEHMRLFLLPSGKAGFALKDGDMVSVFSHKRHGHVGKPSYALVALAVQMGAIKGDCYGTILPDLYAQFGFRAVARDRFNAEFAPESMQEPGHMERWYSDQGGKPDVVYLVYKGNRARVVEEFDPEAESGFESLPYSDFDECLEIQSRAVEAQRDKEEAAAKSLSGGGDDSLPLPDSAFYSDSTFSLTSIQKVVSSLTAPSMKATRAAELVKDCDKAAENWRRIMSGKADRPSARVGAELFGMVSSFLSAARYVLPEGYRSHVDMQMQWASVYAAMAESGEIPPKGTLRSGEAIYKKFEESMINNTTTAASAEEVRDILAAIGSQRLDRVMGKILDRVRGQLIRFAKDELYLNTMERVEVIYPKKEIGKKSPRGHMEAQAYRAVARYREMLGATAEVKAEAMETLEAKYNTEEDEEKRQEHEEDIIAWKTYGDYKGMSLPQAQAAMEKLLEFIMAGRNSWADKLRKEGGRNKFAARQIQKNLPAVNSGSSRAGAKIEHRTKLRKLLASLPYSFMSYAQLMLALEPVLGQRFSRARIKEISDANAALLNASNDRSAWLFDTICRITGVKSESEAEQWMVAFNTPEKTDIPIAPVIPVRVTLPIEDAKEWFSLSRGERDARRKEIREEDRRTETVTENVPEEEDILLLRQALDEYEKKSPEQQQYQKNLTSLREVPNEDGSGILTCSRDCALYAILLHEQPDYADMYDDEGNMIRKGFLRREGLDDEGIAALYDFVGPDGLEYGYALRGRLQKTGKTLAKVYEERMGVPFTFKENYFRATFDRNSTKEKDALTEPKMGSIGGGKYGLLIDRVIHSENLDFSKAGTLVFLAAAAEQDNYIYTFHITTAWRALLKNKVLEQKLKQHLGEDMMGKLASWVDLIDGASLENNRAFLNLSRMQGMLQKAFAVSVLAGNGYVLMKQSSAILHGFFSGWVPSDVLERADGTRELAHRHISFADYLFHLAASKMGLGDISLKEVMETPYFQARVRGKGAMLAQIGNQMPGQRYSRMEKLPEKAMDLIEWVDVKANLLAMHALANAYYVKAKALNEDNGSPFTDEQLRKAALEQVGMSLELGAQPLTKTQKSMNQAAGGILSKLAFVMKSEQLNKLGMMAAEWKTGSARNRVCAVQSWLALGVTSSLLAWLIAWIKGLDDDDDKEKKWRKYGTTALLGDLTTIPLAGEGVNYLASLITGERVFADSYARTLVDVQGIARTVKKEYEHVADKKEMDWDTHFNNLTALIRAAGVGGAFSRSSSAVVSSYGALSLAAATGANISRTSKDLLSALFRDEDEEERKKKKKKREKKKSERD